MPKYLTISVHYLKEFDVVYCILFKIILQETLEENQKQEEIGRTSSLEKQKLQLMRLRNF